MDPKEAQAHLGLDGNPSASLASAIELVSEAYQAVALAEQRTRDAEKHSDDVEAKCSAKVQTAEKLARACEIRAEKAERRAAALATCLREIYSAVNAEGSSPTLRRASDADDAAAVPTLSPEATLQPTSPFYGEAIPFRTTD